MNSFSITEFTKTSVLLRSVSDALGALVESGKSFHGLFPSLIDRRNGTMLTELPPCIPGQRIGDRAFLGSNLMHDIPTLHTLYGLAKGLDRPVFREAADAYLRRFATHCTDTVTGLFPWGEHSFWQLVKDRVGDGSHNVNPEHRGSPTHDHLRQAPVWLWETLYRFNPRCVVRFAEGLDYHWVDGSRNEYNRHAMLQSPHHWPRGARACDFPRHAGFYLLDWAFAAAKTGRPDFLRQVSDLLDYGWKKRDPVGLLPISSREADNRTVNAPVQTLSLGVSLLEAADLLDALEPDLAVRMRQRARVYLDGFLAAPHAPDKRVFVLLSDRETGAVQQETPIWGSRYGIRPAAYPALTALRGHTLSGNEGLLRWAKAVAHAYAETDFPNDTAVPAMDAGLALGLFAELYVVTREKNWLSTGKALATNCLERYFDELPLPRGATGIDGYDSQMGPGYLLQGLARLGLLERQGPENCPLSADFTAR